MLFGKKKNLADTMFFDEFKKILKNGRKDLKKIEKNMSDIDDGYKILAKKFDTEKVFYGLLMREEEEILEIVFGILIYCETKKINIPNDFFDVLENNSFIYDKYITFIEKLFSLIDIDETARLGYLELEALMYKEMLPVEKKRINYIRELAQKKDIDINTIEVKSSLYAIDLFYNKSICQNPNQDKMYLIQSLLSSMPDDTFNKCGLSPIQLYNN